MPSPPMPPSTSLLGQTILLSPTAATSYWLSCQPSSDRYFVVVASDERAEHLAQQLQLWQPNWSIATLLADAHLPFTEVGSDLGQQQQQHAALRYQWSVAQSLQVLIASAPALLANWLPEPDFRAQSGQLNLDAQCDRQHLVQQLSYCGFQQSQACTAPGTYSVRGGLLDVWLPHMELPVRLDFFGDTIAAMACFEPTSQLLAAHQQQIDYYPIDTLVLSPAHRQRALINLKAMAQQAQWPSRQVRWLNEQIQLQQTPLGWRNLWPLLYSEPAALQANWSQWADVVLWEDPAACQAQWQTCYATMEQAWQHMAAKQRPIAPLEHLLTAPESLLATWAKAKTITIETRSTGQAVAWQPDWHHGAELAAKLATPLGLRLLEQTLIQPLLDVLQAQRQTKTPQRMVLMVATTEQAQILAPLLQQQLGQPIPIVSHLQAVAPTAATAVSLSICSQSLLDNLVLPFANWIALDCSALWPRKQQPSSNKAKRQGAHTIQQALGQFEVGDIVIHRQHGIGRYQGSTRLHIDGVGFDVLKIIYHGGDILYVPVINVLLLTPYRVIGEIRLDTLGGGRWLRARKQVEDGILQLAHQLLRTQAQRDEHTLVPLQIDHALLAAFTADFPYTETADQAQAIAQVLQDLSSEKPMDRLLVGDVGFGKTEVALRAAFATITAGKQVLLLAPTTVLAEQHGQTFRQRMEPFGVSVATASRFVKPQVLQQTLQQLRQQRLDMIIGTHRLLSADVSCPNLGLIIVDEEQRFGVRHKERIKAMRNTAHILTLSATPIPRTLHMAVAGLRQLSFIHTPPPNRAAITTEIVPRDADILRHALQRELGRGGQIYLIHHRIQALEELQGFCQPLLPSGTTMATIHGQMDNQAIEQTMVAFVRGETNVLLATAIVENGLDIPAANTMVIFDAHHFGLAQLHQLRGRIGRGDVQAYAYLVVPSPEQLTKEATLRLATLQRFSALGAGFALSTHDLDQRGSGDLLGDAQSGHIHAVGLSLYGQLLQETLQRIRQGGEQTAIEPELHVPITALLPEAYIADAMQRLTWYQQLATAPEQEALQQTFVQLQQSYGVPPPEVSNLYGCMQLRLVAIQLAIVHVTVAQRSGELKLLLRFAEHHCLNVQLLQSWSRNEGQPAAKAGDQPQIRYQLLPDGRLQLSWPMLLPYPDAELVEHVLQALHTLPKEPVT